MHSDESVGRPIEETIFRNLGLRPVSQSGNRTSPDLGHGENTRRSKQQTTESTHALENELQFDDSLLRALGLVTPARLDDICAAEARKPWVVEGLIARGSLNIAAGDSGLGKSPLFYQLGLCIAAGIRWLNFRTTKGPVIYVDLENAEMNSQGLLNALVKHLSLGKAPENFLLHFGQNFDLHRVVREVKPSLVIIDSLRSYNAGAEEKNSQAGTFLEDLRKLARETETAILLIHHTRKPHEEDGGALEDTPAVQWLNKASGARALINQTGLRLAIDKKVGLLSGAAPSVTEEMALVIRAHVRIRGDSGAIHLARAYDSDTGAELGYRRIAGLDLLSSHERQVLDKLPEKFSFGEARKTHNGVVKKGDQAITDFLRKCIACDLLEQPTHRGPYNKRPATEEPSSRIGRRSGE